MPYGYDCAYELEALILHNVYVISNFGAVCNAQSEPEESGTSTRGTTRSTKSTKSTKTTKTTKTTKSTSTTSTKTNSM